MQNMRNDNVPVLAKARITPPKGIKEDLGIQTGDVAPLVSQHNQVVMMKPSIYAMKALQEAMRGEAEKAGIESPEDVIRIVQELRSGEKPDALAD